MPVEQPIVLATALAAFREAIGDANVRVEPHSLESASTATFATTARILAILKPSSRHDVQRCVAIAARFVIRIYVVSSGRNWGYGSRVPVVSDSVLIDLSALNQIIAIDEDLGWVTIEPGVTQRQLFEYLKGRRSRLWIDATGSSPDTSVIGNAMERGFGHTPYGDHAANLCGLEVVLPNGDLLETGMARFADAHAAPVYKWGLGPSLDGLFTQSNLGIVTRATVWLMPEPEHFQAFFFRCDTADDLVSVVDALRPLRLDGTVKSAIHIANSYKVIAGLIQYPWHETNGATPLTPEIMSAFRAKLNFGEWNGSGGLYGTRAQVAEARRLIRVRLKGKVARITFLDERLFRIASRYSALFGLLSRWNISRALDLARPVFGLLKGVPTERPLAAAYWRKRNPPPVDMDPDRDRCGLMWCAPVAPTDGEHARKIAEISIETILKHRFEPLLSFTMITERALICVISLTWDRDVAGEDQNARVCFEELQDQLLKAGYPPYRLGIQAMNLIDTDPGYTGLLQALKSWTDPAGILAPGRYLPL